MCLLEGRRCRITRCDKITHPLGRNFKAEFIENGESAQPRATRASTGNITTSNLQSRLFRCVRPPLIAKETGSENHPRGCVILSHRVVCYHPCVILSPVCYLSCNTVSRTRSNWSKNVSVERRARKLSRTRPNY